MAKSFLVLYIAVDICLAFSTVFENFTEGICKTGDDELKLWDVSPQACFDECRARASCKSINVHTGTRMCEINEGSCSVSSEVGFLYSEKSQWTKVDLSDECKGVDCAPDEICTLNQQTGKTQCTVKECARPDPIEFGYILGSERSHTKRVYYMCNRGYTLKGTGQRTCLSTGTWSGDVPTCELEWIRFSGSWYLFGAEESKGVFYHAKRFCESKNASKLLQIDTLAENDFITSQLRRLQGNKYWLGVTDRNEENDWRYLYTGRIVDRSLLMWAAGEPNGGSNDDCVVMAREVGYKWFDVPCSGNAVQFLPICEYSGS